MGLFSFLSPSSKSSSTAETTNASIQASGENPISISGSENVNVNTPEIAHDIVTAAENLSQNTIDYYQNIDKNNLARDAGLFDLVKNINQTSESGLSDVTKSYMDFAKNLANPGTEQAKQTEQQLILLAGLALILINWKK